MARPVKKKAVKAPNQKRITGQKHVEALADNYVVARYATDHDNAPMEEQSGFITPVTEVLAYSAERVALMTPRRWRALTITVCDAGDNKPYRLIAYGESQQTFVGWQEGIKPFLAKLLKESERNLNPNHLKARATVFTPVGQYSASFSRIVAAQRKFLRLADTDITAIGEMLSQQPTSSFKYNLFDALELDDKLRVLFTEQRLEGL